MTIGLFAPLPLAIMIPFMAAQSFAMGQAFGTSFQYGKRKISSMSNEEFNAMDAEALHKQIQSDIREMIPSMNQSFATMEKFQSEVVNSIIKGVWETLQGLIPGLLAPGDNSQTQTSTSFNVFGEGGTVTDVRLGGGQRTSTAVNVTRSQLLDVIKQTSLWTKQKLEEVARMYMDVTGLADFERAKDKVRQLINAKNKPTVNAPRVAIPVQPHTFQKLVSGLSLVEINSNIANYRALVKKWENQVNLLRNHPSAQRNARQQLNNAKRLLLDWLKKGRNYQILLRNR